jgi:hypothetical protein
MVDTPRVAVLNRICRQRAGDACILHRAALRAVFSKWFVLNAFP